MDIKNLLTSREFEILSLIMEGKSNTQIAKSLFISIHTVKAHIESIYSKFGVHNKVQVTVRAILDYNMTVNKD